LIVLEPGGQSVGAAVLSALGANVGIVVVGLGEGAAVVGLLVMIIDGFADGKSVGLPVCVGKAVGRNVVGDMVGVNVGLKFGFNVGREVGLGVGVTEHVVLPAWLKVLVAHFVMPEAPRAIGTPLP